MAIIYTYTDKNALDGGEKFLISDGSDSNKTKNVTLQALKTGLNVIESILPGNGISISGTNDVTITNTGVLSLTSTNSAIVASASTGGIDITSTVYGGGPTIGHVPEGGGSSTFLRGDGTWAPATGTAANPGGSPTQMQYNFGGVTFGGTVGLTWDNTTNILSIGTRFEGDIDGALLQQVLVKEPGGVSKGDVVYISGGTGDNPEVMKAQANSASTMAALGIMKNNTAVDVVGECVTSGEITGLNLTGFTTGDELFVSNTVAGGLLISAPTGEANLVQKIGKVIKGGSGGALTVLGAYRTNATPNLDKGGIFVGDSNNSSSILPVGTNNYVLTANSAASQGVEWKQAVSQDTNIANGNLSFDGIWSTTIGQGFKWTIKSDLGPAPGEMLISLGGGVDFGEGKPTAEPTSVSMVKGTFNKAQNNWEVSASGTNPQGGTGWPTPPTTIGLDLRTANNNYFDLFQSVDVEVSNAKVGATYKFIAYYQEPTFKLTLFFKDGLVKFPNSTNGNVGTGVQIHTSTAFKYDVYDLYCVREPDPDNGIIGIMLATQSLNH